MAYERTEIPREKIEAQEAVAERLRAHFTADGKTPLAFVDTHKGKVKSIALTSDGEKISVTAEE